MYIPHTEFDSTIRADDDIIAVHLVTVYFFVQMNVPHNTIDKTGRKGRLPSVVYVSFEIGRKPDSNITRTTLDFKVEMRARVLAAHFSSDGRCVAAYEHGHAMINRLVPCSIMRQDKRQVYGLMRRLDSKVPFRSGGIFDFPCPNLLVVQETICLR